MSTFEKINNIVFASVFGAIGLTAFIAAVFFGAAHQFIPACLCAMMTLVLWGETKQKKCMNNNHKARVRLSKSIMRNRSVVNPAGVWQ